VTAIFRALGSEALRVFQDSGKSCLLLYRSAKHFGQIHRSRRMLLTSLHNHLVKSFLVNAIVAVFAGMILSLQTGLELARYGQQSVLGTIVAIAMCREMGPFITGLILTATVGSALAAELGTMKVSEEIDALEVMSIDPERYLVLPRILSVAITCPVLTIFSNLFGILGGAIVGQTQIGITADLFLNTARDALEAGDKWLGLPKDVYTGLVKAFVFGISIGTIGCGQGLRAQGGALGVGTATTRAVINGFLFVIVLSYAMTSLFYRE
jgi:phospholipid/cholesterol/gamma-HCH transport system permease protein